MYLDALEHIYSEAVLDRGRRFVRYDVIDGIINLFEVVHSLHYLLVSRLLSLPPVGLAAELDVLTVTAAEGEYALALDSVYLTAHKVDEIRRYNASHTAVPHLGRVAFENVEILVAAVDEGDSVILGSELPESGSLTL